MQSMPHDQSTDVYHAQVASSVQPEAKPLSAGQKLAWPFFNFAERRLRAFWRLLLQLVITIIFLLVPFLIVGAVAVAINDEAILQSDLLGAVIQSVAFVLATLICFVILDRRHAWGKLGRVWVHNLIFGMVLGAAAMTVIMVTEYMLGWVEITRFGSSKELSWSSLLRLQFVYLIVFTAVAFGEESFSRAYQLKNISEGLSFLGPAAASGIAIFLTSAIFALLHWFNPNANVVSTLGVMLAGIMLAAARVFTGSLAAPVGIHLTWNFFQGPMFGFPVSGTTFATGIFEIKQGGPESWTGGAFGPEAGLMGVVVIALMLVALWYWSQVIRRSIPLEIIKLAHYKPRWRPVRLQPKPEVIATAASAQTIYEESRDTLMIDDSSLSAAEPKIK